MSNRYGEGRGVLLTNMWLHSRSGTEVVTRDYALGLTRRGWRVAIQARELGETARELDGRIQVVCTLDELGWVPDLIHANQHPALTPAMARFPRTPAIQFRHDAKAWHDQAQRFERIRLHVAVDQACREAAMANTGLPASRIPILGNAVDLDRCRPRGPLPATPRRVLIVANRRAQHAPAVREACEAAGLEVVEAGYGVGRPSLNLEAEMAGADIVVGAARIALEAMAVGCAALVCDWRGLAGFATAANFDAWRAWNFGSRLLTRPVTAESVAEALRGYDAADAMAVRDRARAGAGLETALDQLEALYRSVLEADYPPLDQDREAADFAAYLEHWLPTNVERSPFVVDIDYWRTEAHVARSNLSKLVAELGRQGVTVEFGTPVRGL